jgi:hypothetical protein
MRLYEVKLVACPWRVIVPPAELSKRDVEIVGDVPNTSEPVPVGSVMIPRNSVEVVEAKRLNLSDVAGMIRHAPLS